jgi:hypothetical protein
MAASDAKKKTSLLITRQRRSLYKRMTKKEYFSRTSLTNYNKFTIKASQALAQAKRQFLAIYVFAAQFFSPNKIKSFVQHSYSQFYITSTPKDIFLIQPLC